MFERRYGELLCIAVKWFNQFENWVSSLFKQLTLWTFTSIEKDEMNKCT